MNKIRQYLNQQQYNEVYNSIMSKNDRAFTLQSLYTISEYGNVILIEQLMNTIPLEYINEQKIIAHACKSGSIELLLYLTELFPKFTNYHIESNILIKNACLSGKVAFVSYILHQDELESFDIHDDNEQCLKNAVLSGSTELVKYLLSLDTFDIHVNNDILYKTACYNFNKSLLEHFIQCYDGSIHSHNELALHHACLLGNNEFVAWLFTNYEPSTFDISGGKTEYYENCIVCTAQHGHLSTFKIIEQYFDITDHITNCFDVACTNRHFNVIYYILNKYTIKVPLKHKEFIEKLSKK